MNHGDGEGATPPGVVGQDERGRRAFEDTIDVRAELDAALPVHSGAYLRSLAAQGMPPKEMIRRVKEDTDGVVLLRGHLLGKLLVAEAWANGELVTPRKAARNEALAAEADARSAGRVSPGRKAWVSTTHIRDAAIAALGRPAYERALAGFVRGDAEPAVVLSWLRKVIATGAAVDEHLAQQTLDAHVWAGAVRAGLVDDPTAGPLVRPARGRPGTGGSKRREPAAVAGRASEAQARPRPSPKRGASAEPEKPSTPAPPRPTRRAAREPKTVADERRLDAVLGRPAGDFILKHMRIAMSQGMSEAEAAQHVAAALIARGARKSLTGPAVLKVAERNGWETEAARRAARTKERRRQEKRRQQVSKAARQGTSRESAGSVWDKLARTSHARFVAGGLPGLGKRR